MDTLTCRWCGVSGPPEDFELDERNRDRFWCPNCDRHTWLVDASGGFIKVMEDCIQTTHGPDNDNIWTCMKCGAEALKFECRRVHVRAVNAGQNELYYLFFPMQDDSIVYWRLVGCPETHKAVIKTASESSKFVYANGALLPIECPWNSVRQKK